LSLKIIKFEPRLGRVILLVAAAICVVIAWSFIKWNFANTIAARMDMGSPGADRVADWLTAVGPGDPQTHLTAALVYERTFDPNDLVRSLSEYEAAAALSPFDYLRWLDLGKARGLSGDDEGARQAYARADELAPNYAAVQWAYGNSLIRSGDLKEGFALTARAAAANSDYSRPAVTAALQIFDGDLGQVRDALGDTDNTNAALAATLASGRRFDEASEEWSKLSTENRTEKFRPLGLWLIDQMANAKTFRPAVRIATDLQPNEAERPVVGQVLNGGFEDGVKLRNAPLFEWQIAAGEQPQIGLAEGQTHSGRYPRRFADSRGRAGCGI
jgi:tetratricopeptide (TPR) repeat protein